MSPAGIIKFAIGSVVILTAVGVFLLPKAAAQQTTFYFYHGYAFGSEATYNLLSTILNGGYGILQLGIRDWSFFPTLNPVTGLLENNGQNFAMKWRFSGQQTWSLFYNFGLNGIAGLSYKRRDGTSISMGGGIMARSLRQVTRDDQVRSLTADLVWNVGIFYDREGSLMASLFFSGSRAYKARANLYPGLIRIAGITSGVFAAVGQKDEFIFGMSLRGIPLGLALQK